MKFIFAGFLIIEIILLQNAYCQDNTRPRDAQDTLLKSSTEKEKYNCWLWSDSSRYRVRKGYIYNVLDSGIVFRASATGNTFQSSHRQLIFMNASLIDKIKVRKRASVGYGILKGGGIGFLTGALLGVLHIPDYGIFDRLPAEQNALAGGILFSIPGMIIGGIVSSVRVKIPIHKNQLEFNKHKKVLASYSITSN